MKIVFEHLDRKTIIIGSDYESIMNKIRLLFPDENDSRVLFYDSELNDFFDFTSYDQIQDQANGLKMIFRSTNKLNDSSAGPNSTSIGTSNDTESPALIKRKRKRVRREEDDYDRILDEPIILPTYCELVLLGLKSQETFSSIKKVFLDQTTAHFLDQYSNSSSKSLHHAFTSALTEQYPILNYLNRKVDGKNCRAANHTFSKMFSRRKRNIKYYKAHSTPKRAKLSTIEPNKNVQTGDSMEDERLLVKESENDMLIGAADTNFVNTTSSICSNVPTDSGTSEPATPLSNRIQQSRVLAPTSTTSNESSATTDHSRRATISLMMPTTSSQTTNLPIITTVPIPYQLPLTAASTNTFLYKDGRIQVTPVQAQPIVAVHKALLPRDTNKANRSILTISKNTISSTTPENPAAVTTNNTLAAVTTNSTSVAVTTNSTSATSNELNVTCKPISTDTTSQQMTKTNDVPIPWSKISKSERNAYDRDIARLRAIIKPKGKASQNASIVEINALLRSTHRIRRQMILGKKDTELDFKASQHQEIFHEEGLIYEYSLIKDKAFSYDELESNVRALLDEAIVKCAISTEYSLTEKDFQVLQKLCDDLHEPHLIFKNGLTDPHPIIGVLMIPSIESGVQKAFMFIRRLPFKMHVHIGAAGLHKVVALLIIVYLNLGHSPGHKLLSMLIESSKENR